MVAVHGNVGPNNDLEEAEDASEQEDEESTTTVRYLISSYGADYPVDSIVSRLTSKAIDIPEFQRGFVWSWAQASKFIESLLIGLPVPGIFLSRDPGTQKLFVIDGQQRLQTLSTFYEGVLLGREFKLRGVNEEFEGLTYKTLDENDRIRLDDAIIHATIIKQDDPEDDHTSIYLVFERLNTLGTPLSPQEIRACVYDGKFSRLLGDLDDNEQWRLLYTPSRKRSKGQEMILRFFSLFYNFDSYKRPMKLFLTDFMASNRGLEKYGKDELERLFAKTVGFSVEHLSSQNFRIERGFNTSVADAVLVAVASRLDKGEIKEPLKVRDALLSLVETDEFIDMCKVGTTDEDNVRGRISLAVDAIKSLP